MGKSPSEIGLLLTDRWTAAFKNVLSSMTAGEHSLAIKPAGDADEGGQDDDSWVWYAQEVNVLPGPSLWIGASKTAWQALGGAVLAALDVAEASPEDRQATSQDLVAQSTSALAQDLSRELDADVSCRNLTTSGKPSATAVIVSIGGVHESDAPALWFAFHMALAEELAKIASEEEPDPASATPSPVRAVPARAGELPRTIADLDLNLYVALGRTTLRLDTILTLNVGSMIDLGRSINDPVDVVVNGRTIAHGQVVACNGNYAVQIIPKDLRGER